MKIVQFGLHYSPNVGDGVISETLGYTLQSVRPDVEFETVDISGRSGFGAVTVRNRSLALAVLGALPQALRGRLVEARLNRMLDGVEEDWRRVLAGAELVILGGGQIFSDADLNFCTKIGRLAALVRETETPVVVHAAGVSRNWSDRGTTLFGRLFDADLRGVGLRDSLSIENWGAQTSGRGPAPVCTRDPGLLAAECYGPVDQALGDIALGITAPQVLHYHSDAQVAGAGQGGLSFFAELAVILVERGYSVRLFCNGAQEDRAAMAKVTADPRVAPLCAEGQVVVAPAPNTPADLACIIRSADAVIAHRMHACIVAYSYAIPVVGLGWDRKLESFLLSVQDPDGFIGSADATAWAVADRVEARLASGVDRAVHGEVLEETRAGVAGLLSLL